MFMGSSISLLFETALFLIVLSFAQAISIIFPSSLSILYVLPAIGLTLLLAIYHHSRLVILSFLILVVFVYTSAFFAGYAAIQLFYGYLSFFSIPLIYSIFRATKEKGQYESKLNELINKIGLVPLSLPVLLLTYIAQIFLPSPIHTAFICTFGLLLLQLHLTLANERVYRLFLIFVSGYLVISGLFVTGGIINVTFIVPYLTNIVSFICIFGAYHLIWRHSNQLIQWHKESVSFLPQFRIIQITVIVIWVIGITTVILSPDYLRSSYQSLFANSDLTRRLQQSSEQAVDVYLLAIQKRDYPRAFALFASSSEVFREGYTTFLEVSHAEDDYLGDVKDYQTQDSSDEAKATTTIVRERGTQKKIIELIRENGLWKIKSITY